ncbi:MAG: hypothetical protein ABI629_18445 [bacterium]
MRHDAPVVDAAANPGAAPAAVRQPPVIPPRAPGGVAGTDPVDDEPDELNGDAIAAAWAKVDLAAVRKALPDNLYWTQAMPTQDEAEIERRASERQRWNELYGKILSGTGSDEEIRAYFDERAHLSGDYVEFTTYLLDHYSDDLLERDVSLLQLARRLHLARLEEVPRRMQEALERKQQQDEARAKWQAEERDFNQ